MDAPIKVAFGVQPLYVVPLRLATLFKLFVVCCYIWTSVIRKRAKRCQPCYLYVGLAEPYLSCRLCCSSYLSVERPAVISLPSFALSISVSLKEARVTSSIAPVLNLELQVSYSVTIRVDCPQ